MARSHIERRRTSDVPGVQVGSGAGLGVAVMGHHTPLIEEGIARARRLTALFPLLMLLLVRPAHSQGNDGVYWRIDPNVKTCSMVIDPSLTQAQWGTFVRQAGAMVSFKSLASAEPLGRGRFAFGIDYSVTPVDQHDPAWINTFTHPDADCPLGDQIKLPTLRATFGVSSTMDVVGFWSEAPRANYGLAGGAFKYAFLKESERVPAAAITASFASLTGVPDFDFGVYSVGVSASKRVARLAPYLGIKESVAIGTETTSKVDLARETIPLTHGFMGVTGSIWKFSLAAEYSVAAVNTFAFQVGARF